MPGNWMPASATGPGTDDRTLSRDTADANIEETAYAGAQNKNRPLEKPRLLLVHEPD